MSYKNIIVDVKDRVATLTLNRPEKMNALNDGILIDMQHAMDALELDKSVRAMILTGAGKAFCAGFDLTPRGHPFKSVQDWREHVKLGNDTWYKIWRSRLPVIAAVNGYCLGGGCDLSMVCDFTIAADHAQFGEPEIQFQSSPPFFIMPWIVPMKQAKELLLTGGRVGVDVAERIGLINRSVPADKLLEAANEFAQQLVKIPPPAMELNKKALNHGYEIRGFLSTIEYGAEIFALTMLSESDEAKEFRAVAAKEGLKAAFKWRDEKFAIKR
jgi:enoyl-CoA hydratase/carnithine racemase